MGTAKIFFLRTEVREGVRGFLILISQFPLL